MSSSFVNCACGAKVRLPATPAAPTMRCPQCQAELRTPVGYGDLRTTTVTASSAFTCQICQMTTDGMEATHTCPGCQQVYHQECWDEIGGCGTYGCSAAPAADKSEQSVQAPLTAWGDTKQCPACRETIKSIALRCRYCGTDFSTVDPLSLTDLHQQARIQDENEAFKKVIVGLFVVALIGGLAPLVLLVGLIYLLPRRKQLARCGPLFVIMGYTSLFLSGLYCILILVFLVTLG